MFHAFGRAITTNEGTSPIAESAAL